MGLSEEVSLGYTPQVCRLVPLTRCPEIDEHTTLRSIQSGTLQAVNTNEEDRIAS